MRATAETRPDRQDLQTLIAQLLLAKFRIDVFPVTNRQKREFLRQDKRAELHRSPGWFLREPTADRFDHPVTGVSWRGADAYCRWLSAEDGRGRGKTIDARLPAGCAQDVNRGSLRR